MVRFSHIVIFYFHPASSASRYKYIKIGGKWPQFVHSLYWSFSKPLFVTGMFLTILPSLLGIQHSFFNLVLSNKILTFIAKISFCSYLVHMMVINQFLFTQNYDFYFDTKNTFVIFSGLLLITLFWGFLMTMLMELPFAKMIKLAFSS